VRSAVAGSAAAANRAGSHTEGIVTAASRDRNRQRIQRRNLIHDRLQGSGKPEGEKHAQNEARHRRRTRLPQDQGDQFAGTRTHYGAGPEFPHARSPNRRAGLRFPLHPLPANPALPGLPFKKLDGDDAIYSARISLGQCALAVMKADRRVWCWIGNHSEYDRHI